MEFKFNINEIFQHPIVELNNNMIPPGFSGDRRQLWDTVTKVSEVVNAMGEASANAQGLTKPITTAERLRNSEHRLYLLIDHDANNGKGAVTGMLKTGTKGLYVFDKDGQHYQVSPPCVLDFYVHETRQRTGLGKHVFEYMLKKEGTEPVKMAIDRPSEKFLGFLNKHYGLHSPVKQMNNYVVFDDFFPKPTDNSIPVETDKSITNSKRDSANGLQNYPSSPYGRYGAPRPPCSMGQIIHNQSSTITKRQEPTGVQSMPTTNYGSPQNSSLPNEQVTQSAPNISYRQYCTNDSQKYGNVQNTMTMPQCQIIQATPKSSQQCNHFPQQNQICNYQNCPQQEYNASQPFVSNQNQVQYPNVPFQATPIGSHIYYQHNMSPTPNIIQNASEMQISKNHSNYNSVTEAPYQTLSQHGVRYQESLQPVDMQQNSINKLQYSTCNDIPASKLRSKWTLQEQVPLQAQAYGENNSLSSNQQNTNHSKENMGFPQAFSPINYVPPSQQINQNPYLQADLNHTNVNVAPQPVKSISYMENDSQYQTNKFVYDLNQANSSSAKNCPQCQLHAGYNDSQTQWNNEHNVPMSLTRQFLQSNPDLTQTISQPNSNIVVQTSNVQTPSQNNSHNICQLNSNQNLHQNVNSLQQLQQQARYFLPMQHSNPIRPSVNQPHTVQANFDTYKQQELPENKCIQLTASQIHPYIEGNQNTHMNTIPNSTLQTNQEQENMPKKVNLILNQHPYQQQQSTCVHNNMMNVPNISLQNDQTNVQVSDVNQTNIANDYGNYNHQNTMMIQKQSNGASISENINSSTNYNNFSANNNLNNKNGTNSQETIKRPYERDIQYIETNTHAEGGMRKDKNLGRTQSQIMQEDLLKHGYPLQNDSQSDEKPHSTKLERPRSLSIQPNEEPTEENSANDINTKVESTLQDHVIEVQAEIENVKLDEQLKEYLEDVPDEVQEHVDTSGRKTPSHLTEQGYFDLKFYHNKLW